MVKADAANVRVPRFVRPPGQAQRKGNRPTLFLLRDGVYTREILFYAVVSRRAGTWRLWVFSPAGTSRKRLLRGFCEWRLRRGQKQRRLVLHDGHAGVPFVHRVDELFCKQIVIALRYSQCRFNVSFRCLRKGVGNFFLTRAFTTHRL